jgi:hypothetical protein
MVAGQQQGVPAMGVVWSTTADGLYVGTWRQCSVTSYDAEADQWHVVWTDDADADADADAETSVAERRSGRLHRLHVCFVAEDPVNFANRVAHAHTMRRNAESRLRCAPRVGGGPDGGWQRSCVRYCAGTTSTSTACRWRTSESPRRLRVDCWRWR